MLAMDESAYLSLNPHQYFLIFPWEENYLMV